MAHFFLLNGLATLLVIGVTRTCGDDVVLCFLRNPLNRNTYGDTDIYVTSDVDGASVTVYEAINGVNQTVLLEKKYERFTLRFNSSISRLGLNMIENKGIMITSVDNIYVLGFSSVWGTSTDVFTPRPVTHLGLVYVVLTNCQLNVAHCEVGVASVLEPANIIVYIPAQFTGSIEFNGTTYQACDVIQLTLQPLQTVQFASKADLTGMLISSDREIAAFAGADKTRTFTDQGRDHLSASLPPLTHWGNHYIVVRDSTAQHADVIKVVSSKNDTNVLLTGCGSTTLFLMHAFQDYLNHSFTCEFVEISAENDILVSHFVVKTEWLNAGMYYPVPVQYYTSKYVVPVAPFYEDCQLSLVARDGEQNNILVQDTVISAQWTSIPSSPFVVTTVTVSNTEVLRVTDISGETFGGHLTCFSSHTTAATVLLPKDISFTANVSVPRYTS